MVERIFGENKISVYLCAQKKWRDLTACNHVKKC